jgi:hypothetical protein
MGIEDYQGKRPELRPEKFLTGELEGWGIIEGPLGGLKSRYTIRASGAYIDRIIKFTETWKFDDGTEQTLNWQIRTLEGGKYEGTETKLVGTAKGERAGFVFHWQYTRDVPVVNGDTRLNFDDWFYLIDDHVCIVRGTAGRAGVPFATAHVTYRKLATDD